MRTILTSATLLAAALALAGCSDADGTASTTTSTTAATTTAAGSSSTAGPATSTAPVTVSNAWAKATDATMTGVFATLTNTSGKPVVIRSAASPAAGMTELHVTQKDANGAMVMKKTTEGFTIPAGGTFELAPGGNHVMLMKLKQKVLSGTEVPVTLTLDDGATVPITARAREYNGAKETYAPTATASGAVTGSASASTSGTAAH